MRRTMAVLLVIGLLGAAMVAPADARKKKKKKATVRVMEVRYENPALGVGGAGGGCSGCPSIVSGPKEKFAMIVIIDDNTPAGYVDFSYDSDGDGFQNIGSGPTVCGETPKPVAVEPATSYTAWPWAAGVDCPGGSSTSGTIKAFFSSDPKALKKAVAKAT